MRTEREARERLDRIPGATAWEKANLRRTTRADQEEAEARRTTRTDQEEAEARRKRREAEVKAREMRTATEKRVELTHLVESRVEELTHKGAYSRVLAYEAGRISRDELFLSKKALRQLLRKRQAQILRRRSNP